MRAGGGCVATTDHRADGGDRLQRGEDGLSGRGAVGELQLSIAAFVASRFVVGDTSTEAVPA